MVKTDKHGVYHATNEGYISWYEFACEIFKKAGLDVKVNTNKTEDYPTKAKRPKNSRLSKEILFKIELKPLNLWINAAGNITGELKQ